MGEDRASGHRVPIDDVGLYILPLLNVRPPPRRPPWTEGLTPYIDVNPTLELVRIDGQISDFDRQGCYVDAISRECSSTLA